MERRRDLTRATVPAFNGFPRRRQRITTPRDPNDLDRQMEVQKTQRFGGGEREFPKRRRIDRPSLQQKSDGETYIENSTDSSDEECYVDDEEMRIHRTNQLSPSSSSLTINPRRLRKLRSSPVLRADVNEILGVSVPRRARSSSAKRLNEYCHSGVGKDLNHRRFSPPPVSLIGSDDSTKKKIISVERRTTLISNPPKRPLIQDDIEIEVAEALFDLMKQSQSELVDRYAVISTTDEELVDTEFKMSKADGDKSENNAFSVQNVPSIKVNAETVSVVSMEELKKEGTVEEKKFSDDSPQDSVSGDGFVNKVKVGSPKENDSPSCAKVNASGIQDPTVTKAHYDAIIVEAKKETQLEIDLMRSEVISKGGSLADASRMQGEKSAVINSNPQSNADVEKHNHDTTHHQEPTSLFPFSYGMSGWPGVVPHPGFMPTLHAVMPINGSAKSSTIMQPPRFKFSQSHPKRCVTHQYLAQSMHCHQELIKKSLSSESTGPVALCQNKSSNLCNMSPAQNFIPENPFLGGFQGGQNSATVSVGNGKDKSSDAAVVCNTMASKTLHQQASQPISNSNFLHGPGFVLPFGQNQATMMAPANISGSTKSASLVSSLAERLPVSLPLYNTSTAMSSNLPMFPPNEAASYMTMLHNNGCSVPISTNIAMSSFKGGASSMAFFNPSFIPPPVSKVTENQQHLTTSRDLVQSASQNKNLFSHKQPQCVKQADAQISENKFPTSATANSQPEKRVQRSQLSSKSEMEINLRNGAPLASGFASHSVKSSQAMNFAMIPPVSVGGCGGNKQIDLPQQGSNGRDELIPQAFVLSFGSNASATPVLNFSSMAQASAMFQVLPNMSRNGNQVIPHKNFQASEGKYFATDGKSFNNSKSDCSEISALSTVEPPKFDCLTRNFNFLPSTAVLSSGFQQHQFIQVQDLHMHQMPLTGTGQVKSSTSYDIPGSLPSSRPGYDNPSFHPKWENFSRSVAPEGSPPQLKPSRGQTHINFGNGPISATPLKGHQYIIKSESMSSVMVGWSSNSSLPRNVGSSQRNSSTMGLAASTTSVLPSQEAEASQGGASQKLSVPCL